MNSEQRVHAALRREPVDRPPIFMWFHPQTAQRLARALEIPASRVSEAMGDDVRQNRVNDATAGLLSQDPLDHELGDENKAIDVDRNERAQIGHRVIRELLRDIDAGVVDERVDPAESGYGSIDNCCGRAGVTDVSVD